MTVNEEKLNAFVGKVLAGDVGISNVNPFDTEPTPVNQWIVEGPHIMLIVPNLADLETVSTDPYHGGPYVMFPGTPFAHIMVPTDERPEQPVAAATR